MFSDIVTTPLIQIPLYVGTAFEPDTVTVIAVHISVGASVGAGVVGATLGAYYVGCRESQTQYLLSIQEWYDCEWYDKLEI